MESKKILAAATAALVASSTGCAAIMAPRTDSLYVSANVPGAQVYADGVPRALAPARIEIDRKRPEAVRVEAAGYTPVACDTGMSAGGGYVAGDIAWCVLLFPFGCIAFIDASGAWNTLDRSSCSANMAPTQTAPAPAIAPYPAPPAQPQPAPTAPLAS